MQVAKVTLKDGFFFYADHESEDFRDIVGNVQRNRGSPLDVVELQEMTQAEYVALGTNSEINALMQPRSARASND